MRVGTIQSMQGCNVFTKLSWLDHSTIEYWFEDSFKKLKKQRKKPYREVSKWVIWNTPKK